MDKNELAKFETLSEALRHMVHSAYFDSKKAHDLIFTYNKDKQIAALAYLNKAAARMSAAESLYYSHYDILCHNDIEGVFNAFDIFSNELIENYSTDHSHQWTDIEFLKFQEALRDSVFALSEI